MQDEYNFQEFNAITGRYTPLISLMETGTIGLSAGFTRAYEVQPDKYTNVKLYFDGVRNAVGLKFVKSKLDGTLPIRFIDRGGAQINAASFWIKFNIDPRYYVNKFRPKQIENNNEKIYVFELNNSVNQQDIIENV
jgi:hypothetical protein